MCITIYDLEDSVREIMTVDEMASQPPLNKLEEEWRSCVNPTEFEEHKSWKNPTPLNFQLNIFQT